MEILLAEDNANDAVLTRIAFERAGFRVNLHHVGDGHECLAYLRNQGRFAGVPRPELLLLDLDMPRMGGREVMRQIASDPLLCHLPVIVITSSGGQEEIVDLYRLRCNSYIVKPVDFDRFLRVIGLIAEYWTSAAARPLPTGKGGAR